ncbi:hypothetical protein ACFQL4_01975 [Halosimplex aquaticum]
MPTDTTAPGEALSPPPGVAANGSISPTALGAAHRRALANRSFTWSVEYERRDLNAGVTVDAVSKRLRVGRDGSYLFRTERSPGHRDALYANGTDAYARTVLGNASTVRHLASVIDYRNYLTTTRSLRRYLPTRGASVARVERGGQTFYRLHATAPARGIRDGHPKLTIHNYSATAYLTPAGFVRSLVVSYDYQLRTDRVAVALRADYGRVGETTVDRPEWATESRGARRDGDRSSDERLLRARPAAGYPVPNRPGAVGEPMTRRRRWAMAAITLLVVLGGCSALSPSADAPATDTITPVPVPSATDSAGTTPTAAAPTVRSDLDSFPGVSARTGIDVERLLSAHVAYLSTRSYTVEWARWTAGGPSPSPTGSSGASKSRTTAPTSAATGVSAPGTSRRRTSAPRAPTAASSPTRRPSSRRYPSATTTRPGSGSPTSSPSR